MSRKSHGKRRSQNQQPKHTTEARKAPQGVLPFEDAPQGQQITEFTAEFYAGPYPHPELLARYDEIVPGMAQSIVDGVEEQRRHRIRIEDRVITNNIIQAYIGQGTSFIVTLAALYVAYVIASQGNDLMGFGVAMGALATLGGIFYIGRRDQGRELKKKAEAQELKKRE